VRRLLSKQWLQTGFLWMVVRAFRSIPKLGNAALPDRARMDELLKARIPVIVRRIIFHAPVRA